MMDGHDIIGVLKRKTDGSIYTIGLRSCDSDEMARKESTFSHNRHMNLIHIKCQGLAMWSCVPPCKGEETAKNR